MADGAGREPSWIRENGGVIAIVVAIIAVGALIHQGNQQIAARIASLETQFGARMMSLETRVGALEAQVKDLVSRVGRIEGALGVAPAVSDGGEE